MRASRYCAGQNGAWLAEVRSFHIPSPSKGYALGIAVQVPDPEHNPTQKRKHDPKEILYEHQAK